MPLQNQFGKTNWVLPEKLPQVGTMCPECIKSGNHIPLEAHQFTSKKTRNVFKGVICPNCNTSWVISHYLPKPKPEKVKTPNQQEQLVNIQNALKIMNDNIINIADGINKILRILSKEL